MRESLNGNLGKRCSYRATFAGTGLKNNVQAYPDICIPVNARTVLIRDIETWQGYLVADHMWIGMTKYLWNLIQTDKLKVGDRFQFSADVKKYSKGKKILWYRVKEQDLTFCNVNGVDVLGG